MKRKTNKVGIEIADAVERLLEETLREYLLCPQKMCPAPLDWWIHGSLLVHPRT